jgi:phosphopantetheinyl transferase
MINVAVWAVSRGSKGVLGVKVQQKPYFCGNMPLLLNIHPFDDATFSLWKVTEPLSFFEKDLPLSESEAAELAVLREHRRAEWLSSRWLLHRTTGAHRRIPLVRDAFSKPFFLNEPDMFCSLSHSRHFTGTLTARRNCGCDIQVLVDKMPRIAPRFMSVGELAFTELWENDKRNELFHLYWTAKECLYKQYGIRALDFSEHIGISDINWNGYEGTATGNIRKENFSGEYRLVFGKVETDPGHSLVWAVSYEAV